MSLTDDWKKRKLKAGPYYVRLSNGSVDVAKLSKFNRFYAISCTFEVVEVLAPCDYDNFVKCRKQLAEHKDNCCCLENEKLRLDNQELRRLLKECDGCVCSLKGRGVSDCNGSNLNDLLTRINEVLK